jgi:hypothetical protein
LIKKLNNKRDRKEVAIGIPLPVNTIRSMMWSRRVAGAVEPAKFVHPSTFTGARFPFFFFYFLDVFTLSVYLFHSEIQ